MTTTTPDAPLQTWRVLQGRLTPQQVKDLEWQEGRGPDCAPDAPDDYRKWLIDQARDYIAGNEGDAELSARIRPPVGATQIGDWDSIDNKTGLRCRSIQWATHDAGPTSVDIDGWQDDSGAVDGPHLSVYGLESFQNKFEAADARRLARALDAAADELERLR